MSPNNAPAALPLHHTKTVFLHPDDTGLSAPCAVQIDMKVQDQEHADDIKQLYATKEGEISELIMKLVVVHLQQPLPERFDIDDENLVIHASRTPWRYGRLKLVMTWGEERVAPCKDKWTFTLAIRSIGEA